MVLGARDRVRQVGEVELAESGQELRQLLTAKGAENHLRGFHRAGARDKHQDQASEVGVIDQLDRRECGTIGLAGAIGLLACYQRHFFSTPVRCSSCHDAQPTPRQAIRNMRSDIR